MISWNSKKNSSFSLFSFAIQNIPTDKRFFVILSRLSVGKTFKVVVVVLTAKQKRFCDEYLTDFNATQAAIRAGYSEKTARQIGEQNLSKLDIKTCIAERMVEKESKLIATQDEVLQYLTSVLRGEQKEQTFKLVDVGVQEIAEISISTKDRLKAAELLGKAYGAFRDKVDVSGTIPVVISGDDELED